MTESRDYRSFNGPIFVCGIGRSGTSLLQSMIAQNSEIAVPPETHFLRRYALPKSKSRRWREKEIEARYQALASDLYLGRLGKAIFTEENIRSWAEANSPLEAFRKIMAAYCESKARDLYGEKDPRLMEWILSISRALPCARFVEIVRDPRAVAASKKKATWSSGRPFAYNLFASLAQSKVMRKWRKRADLSARILTVQYENVLSAPELELKKICQWLGLDFEIEMLNFSESAKRLVAKDEHAWKKETLGPLLTENNNKWKDSLTPTEIYIVEKSMKRQFLDFDYRFSSMDDIKIGVFRRLWAKGLILFISFASIIYAEYRTWLGQ